MKTTKKTDWPLILAIVAAAVVLALFLWPRILSAGAAHTDWTRQEAQRFIADYQAESGKTLDEKRVCWDLAYLDLIGIQPTSISGERDGRVVYAHQIFATMSSDEFKKDKHYPKKNFFHGICLFCFR